MQWFGKDASVLSVVQVMATLTISATAFFVATLIQRQQVILAKQQAHLASEKLRLDLFEKRYAVWSAVAKVLDLAIYGKNDAESTRNAVFSSLIGIYGPAKYLFDQDDKVADIISELNKKLLSLIGSELGERLRSGKGTFKDFSDARAILRAEVAELENILQKYLSFTHI